MKKKWILAGLVLLLSFSLAACKDKEEVKPEESDIEDTKVDDTKEKARLNAEYLSKLELKTDTDIVDGKLSVSVILENPTTQVIPLDFKKNQAMVITLFNGKEEVAERVEIEEEDRKKINAKETVTWEHEINLKEFYDTYRVKVVLNLVDEKGTVIPGFDDSREIEYKEENTYNYTPRKPATLVYETRDGSGTEATEEFLYFEDGYAQSYSTNQGGNVVYFSDKTGLYRVYSEVSDKKINKIKDIVPQKEQLLKLPVVEGEEWTIDGQPDGIKHKVIEDNATITTIYGQLSNVIIVEADVGQVMRLFYHKDLGMVKTEVKKEDGSFDTLFELKQVK